MVADGCMKHTPTDGCRDGCMKHTPTNGCPDSCVKHTPIQDCRKVLQSLHAMMAVKKVV